MSDSIPAYFNPRFDLVLKRVVDVPPELVWAAWTTPEHLKKWFTPAPWTTIDCEIDLRPGGIFRTIMRSPDGEEFPNLGCYLEVESGKRLVWTSALGPGYRPASGPDTHGIGFFTAMILLEAHGSGTQYTAIVLHKDEDGRNKHAEMGFEQGWGTALEQLVAVAKQMEKP